MTKGPTKDRLDRMLDLVCQQNEGLGPRRSAMVDVRVRVHDNATGIFKILDDHDRWLTSWVKPLPQ